MNPNSQNQRWSKWTINVMPGRDIQRSWPEVMANVSRFMRKAFGSGSTANFRQIGKRYVFEIVSEGHPVHDPGYVNYLATNFQKFFEVGFGPGTVSVTDAKLLAGSRQDGSPADQLLIISPFRIGDC